MDSWITQIRKGLVELCVLEVLSAGESYGYEVLAKLRELDQLSVTESTLYPILARLRKAGYVSVRHEPSQAGPIRRYFLLTDAGTERLEKMRSYWDGLCGSVKTLKHWHAD